MGGHRSLAAFVAELPDLPEQPASGQIRAVPDLVREIALVRLQKPGPRLPRRIGRSREAPIQQFADRLSVQARPPRDRADRNAFPFQFLQHDNLLQLDHPTRASFGKKIGWDFGLLSFRGACPPERIRSPLTGEFCFGAFGEYSLSSNTLPMGLGYVEGYTHNYVRHGCTTLFAALDVATGKAVGRCSKPHRHQEFLAFLRFIDRETPPGLDLYLVLENYATHNHPKISAWLAKRPRFYLHFTPTSASWLSQVERWFALISQRAIKRGSSDSVPHLVQTIKRFIDDYNETAAPFDWVAPADSILKKIERLSMRISGT